VSGDLGDDVIATGSGARPKFSCGRGDDRLSIGLATPAPRNVAAGPFVPKECEWVEGKRYRERLTVSSHPVDVGPSGELTFRVTAFDCCEHVLSLTRPDSPFEELDAAPVDSERVAVEAPAGLERLRVSTFGGGGGEPLAWRFEVDR